MDFKAVRRRCAATVGSMRMPSPFTVAALVETVSEQRGRPLHVQAHDHELGPCGVWLALPDADFIFYTATTSAVHREHIVLHELGHVLSGHISSETPDEALLRRLMPRVDPAVVRFVLARTTYSAAEELEAEVMASTISELARRPRLPQLGGVPESQPALRRLQSMLDPRSDP